MKMEEKTKMKQVEVKAQESAGRLHTKRSNRTLWWK